MGLESQVFDRHLVVDDVIGMSWPFSNDVIFALVLMLLEALLALAPGTCHVMKLPVDRVEHAANGVGMSSLVDTVKPQQPELLRNRNALYTYLVC